MKFTVWECKRSLSKQLFGMLGPCPVSSVCFTSTLETFQLRIRFARSRPDQLELQSVFRVPSICDREQFPKQIIRVDNAYRLAIHSVTIFAEGTGNVEVEPKIAIIHHHRIPDGLKVDYSDFDFVDKNATVRDDVLVADLPALQTAIQKRFGLKTPNDVKPFLGGLAKRRIQH